MSDPSTVFTQAKHCAWRPHSTYKGYPRALHIGASDDMLTLPIDVAVKGFIYLADITRIQLIVEAVVCVYI